MYQMFQSAFIVSKCSLIHTASIPNQLSITESRKTQVFQEINNKHAVSKNKKMIKCLAYGHLFN